MGVEIPAGGDDSPPTTTTTTPKQETAPSPSEVIKKPDANVSEKQQSTKGRNLCVFLFFCGISLAIILALVPDWGKSNETINEEPKESPFAEPKEKPFAKPFDPILPVFNEKVTDGYDNITDLENDLQQFAFLTLNQAISGYLGGGSWGCGGGFYPMPFLEDGVEFDGIESVASAPGGSGGVESKNVFDGVDDFGTNNQEDSIDTADLAKSDGTFIYASYGDRLVVTNVANGKIMSEIRMPKINIEKTDDKKVYDGPYSYYYNYDPTPRIKAILLEGDNMALVVSGYGAEYESKLAEQAPICDYKGTRIMVYDINGGLPQLLRQQDIHGYFKQAYSTNGVGHVVTQASIDTWTHLREPIQRWKFDDLTDEEYEAEATRIAQEKVPRFASELADLLSDIDLTRLSLFVNSIDDEKTLDGIMSQLRVADAIAMVGSFNMNDDSASTELEVSLAGTTQPGDWGYVYANDNMIIVADRGYEWVADKQEYAEMTFLVGFRLDGASAKHEVVGSVFGAPLNPYSLDMVEKDGDLNIRIATTVTFWPGFVFSEEGSDMESSWVSSPTVPDDETSRTWNEIAVLGTSGPNTGLLEKKSSVRLGKPNERFTAVRFLDDIAYAVTFERIDPLYTVDLSNPNDIKVLGELEVTGFSEYLHPIEGGKILAVGQETDEEGQIIGLQISLFGASDPTELSLINRLRLLNEEHGSTSSGASWEPRAFRYFTVGDLGVLIIPVTKWNWGWRKLQEDDIALEKDVPAHRDHFDGFEVFTIQNDVISRYFTIDHYDINNRGNGVCQSWCGDLPERSFVVDGDLITMKGQSVVSTDLNTQRSDWFINMRQAVCCTI